MKTLQIICPVFNEEKMLPVFFKSLSAVLSQLSNQYESKVLFVMDKSSDNTSSVLTELSKENSNVQVLKLSSRFGHQMSLVAGIDHTNSDVIIMMDSDLQHPPELLPELLKKYEEGFDVVYTIRKEPKDKSFIKRLGSKNFYKLMNKLSELDFNSGEADFRLISSRVASVFQSSIRERNQFLRGLFRWVGFNSVGIEYDPLDRTIGESKYNMSRMLRFASSGIVSFSKKPLQYAIYVGAISSIFGLIFTVVTLASYFLNDKLPSGWATLSILISVFGGIQMFFLGIMGEYIGAIFDEVKGRPLYIVDESINLDS